MALSRRPAYSSAFAIDAIESQQLVRPLDDISADWAWGGSNGEGVKVAVIDSGIDVTHPAVGQVAGYAEVIAAQDGTISVTTEPHSDSYGHATACSSIIRSIAPACELYSVKVLGTGLSGSGAVFAAGLRWAIENGMQVCNLSLGTTKKDFYSTFHELADLAYFKNVILVTAANNMPVPSFPSVYASVISVASHDVDDPYLFYYNPKPPVEYGAHGINVRVAWPGNKWMTSTGNSYACPHITGIVAKILGKHPSLTTFQLKTVLRALAANVSPSSAAVPLQGFNDGS